MTFSSPNDIIKSTHAIDAKGGRLPIGIPGRLQIGMHGRLRRYPHTGTLVNDGTTLLYLARKHDCDGCKLKALCCPKGPFRRIPRNQHEAARDITRSFAGTETFEQSRRERKKVEMRFAHLKRILRLGRLRLRGPRGAQDKFDLAAIAQNLRLVARPPPAQALCIA